MGVCRFSHLRVGEHVVLVADHNATCMECGGTVVVHHLTTYFGHEDVDGLRCDKFVIAEQLPSCSGCGIRLGVAMLPCGTRGWSYQLEVATPIEKGAPQ